MTKALVPWVLALFLGLVNGCSALPAFSRAQSSFDRGLALFNQGRFEAAIPYLQNATREDPDFAEAYFYLGRSYIGLSRWRSAIQPLRTAFRLAPQETQGEIVSLLLDAAFAAALNDFHLGDRGDPLSDRAPRPFRETL